MNLRWLTIVQRLLNRSQTSAMLLIEKVDLSLLFICQTDFAYFLYDIKHSQLLNITLVWTKYVRNVRSHWATLGCFHCLLIFESQIGSCDRSQGQTLREDWCTTPGGNEQHVKLFFVVSSSLRVGALDTLKPRKRFFGFILLPLEKEPRVILSDSRMELASKFCNINWSNP